MSWSSVDWPPTGCSALEWERFWTLAALKLCQDHLDRGDPDPGDRFRRSALRAKAWLWFKREKP